MPAAPRTGAEHARLHAFAGEWEGEEVVGPSRWFEPGPARGFVSARMGLDGFYLIQDYRQSREGKTIFSGHALMTFDREDGLYKMFWHDSVGFVPESPATGQWKGEELVLQRASLRGSTRHIYAFSGADAYSLTIRFSPDDEGWSDFLTATYRRVAPASGAPHAS